MKKTEKTTKILRLIVAILLVLTIIFAIYPKSYADLNPTLENIASIFLNCKSVNEYNQNSDTMNLYVTTSKSAPELKFADILTVHVQEKYASTANLVYKLEENILTGEFSGSTDTAETAKVRSYWPIVTNILIDCIEQIHGYAEGEMFDTLNSSQIANYRVSKDGVPKEGLQIINNSPNYYSVQIDISKAVPTIDDNSFIKIKDLEDVKENLSGDGIAKLKKGNVLFYKCTIDDRDVISIGEQGAFSYKINKSIYSILEVMLGSSEAVDYYKEKYPTVGVNKQFEGFKIEVNPVKNSTEGSVFGVDDTYKFVRLTVDREAIKTALGNATKKEQEKEDEQTKAEIPENSNPAVGIGTGTGTGTATSVVNSNNEKLPKTGKNTSIFIFVLYSILISTWVAVMIIPFNKKKKRI